MQTEAFKQEIARVSKEADSLLESCRTFPLDTSEQRDDAVALLREIKAQSRRLVDREAEITKPMRSAIASVRDLFLPGKNACAEAEAVLKARLADALTAVHQATMEEVRAAAGNPQALAEIKATDNPDGLSIRKLARVRVVDIGIVPRKFLHVDTQAVMAAFKAKEIVPGCEIYYVTSVAMR